ncbi:unnamed protein product [Hydatigera taeniaeformis]|uniref:US2 n=1 Tax=Hydatigena taeniaeformis TaxID=6205 RepID=A0A0R3WU23_HYDTA|nr:unnamed protein product [Hydatigera taeniaeformis]
MKRTFMRTKLKAKGKFSMFRQEGFTSMWLTLCCTNGSHAELRIKFPRSSVAYKSTHSRSNHLTPWIRGDPYAQTSPSAEDLVINDSPTPPASRDTPLFFSIDRCPPVNGTRRMIFTLGTYRPSNLTATLLDYGYYTLMCAYYEYEEPPPPPPDTSSIQSNKTLIPSILVEGKTCPPHFSPAPNTKAHLLFYYLRAAFILCKPEGIYRHDAIDKILPDGNQCFISHTPREVKRAEGVSEEGLDGSSDEEEEQEDEEGYGSRLKRYHCPSGFDTTELRWSGGNSSSHGFGTVTMYFCCRKSVTPSTNGSPTLSLTDKADGSNGPPPTFPLPFYLRSVPTFGIIILGGNCPDYSDQGTKLAADFVSVSNCSEAS